MVSCRPCQELLICSQKQQDKKGAQIFEKAPVDEILTKNGRISGVKVNGQEIECEYIVLASGMWSRQIARKNWC